MEKISIPTGFIIVDEYSNGKLETLSIGDYGKSKNIKADFLGCTEEINGVANGKTMPLQEKWVITLSTQYGCSEDCAFCDAPNIKFAGNASFDDLKQQLFNAIECFPDVKYTDRLNIHFARMGEPARNFTNVCDFTRWLHYSARRELIKKYGLRVETIHPVFTTMVPKTFDCIHGWVDIKNTLFNGQTGLQLSINSTNEEQRKDMFKGGAATLEEISKHLQDIEPPLGRKYCLNFALADGYETDGEKLARLFDPEKWMVKITPIHNNKACESNAIKTKEGYSSFTPYAEAERSFKNAGFDVLVFIPSMDEEEGCVTCGNAILGGSELKLDPKPSLHDLR